MIPAFSTPGRNRRVVLQRRPRGIPVAADFAIEMNELGRLASGQCLVRNLYLSADPVQRGWAANADLVPIGGAMRALSVGVVVDSRAVDMPIGSLAYGFLGWQDYAVVGRADLLSVIRDPAFPASAYAGVLGMPGVTAWLALADIAPAQANEQVLVSTAAGAVGSVVGQIVAAAGGQAVGLTGDDEKVARCVDRYGYSAAYNYKTCDLPAVLAQAAPKGFATYFDNTGGWIADHAIRALAKGARIIQCGTAATASWSPPPSGWRPEREVLTRVLTWRGFYIFDHIDRFEQAIASLSELMAAGKLNYDEDVDTGLDRVVVALEDMFAGTNSGKKLVFIGGDGDI